MSSKAHSKQSNKETLDLNWVLKYLKDGVYPAGLNFAEKRMIRKRAERFCYLNGDLYYLGTPKDQELGKKSRKVLLTHEERIQKVQECHIDADGTHFGLERTADGFITNFHWVGIYRFIKDFIRQCAVCQERHPKMLQPSTSFTGAGGDETLDEEASMMEEDSSVCDSEVEQVSSASLVETSLVVEQEPETVTEAARLFWEKVDIRLFGPFKFNGTNKHILVGLDGFSLWPEAYVLDLVSSTTVAQSLLKMICRYGEMCSIVLSCTDELLETSLTAALETLNKESNIQIPLKKGVLESTVKAYNQVADLIGKFVKKYPKSWPDCIDMCLLPLRISKNKEADYTPSFLAHSREPVLPDKLTHSKGGNPDIQLSDKEKLDTVDVMMGTHQALQGTSGAKTVPATRTRAIAAAIGTFTTPQQPSPMKETAEQSAGRSGYVHVTRSRTGNAKPKNLDDETFEISTPKRRAGSSPGAQPPSRKKVKVEPVMTSTPGAAREEEEGSDSEADMGDETAKKAVELDSYYQAIKQYVSDNGYPERSSSSFKRLIRDQARNYVLMSGELYHEVGVNHRLKKIIMTRPERVQLLTETYLKTSVKSQMLGMLESVHWKGKLIDCEAFLLALHNDRHEPKTSKDSLRHLAEAKKQLQYDTADTYQEITNFIIYDVFSDDDTSKRLDYLKRQMKNFRVENNDLHHVVGNKKRRVVITATGRQQAIAAAYQKKGGSADLTSVFNTVSETAFWFAMKLDIRVYLSYADHKHLLDRYFTFREHFMQEPLPERAAPEEAEEEEIETEETTGAQDDDDDDEEEEETEEKPPRLTVTANVPVVISKVSQAMDHHSPSKHSGPTPTGVFMSSNITTAADMPILAQALTNAGDATVTIPTSQTIIPDQPLVMDSAMTETPEPEKTKTVIVRLTESGETIVSSGDGGPDVVLERPPGSAGVHMAKASDEVTVAAVKSILQEQVEAVVHHQPGDGSSYPVVMETEEQTVETTEMATPVPVTYATTADDGTDMGQPQLTIAMGNENEMVITETSTAEAATDNPADDGTSHPTQPDNDDVEDSDDGLYDTDEDEDESDIYDDEDDSRSEVSGLTHGTMITKMRDGERRVVTPRQHFKCSQCDKLFFGPLKFKMHMYKHTGQKPFPCNQCSKKYTNKKSLVIHQRTHSGELPYLCSLCGKRCASKIALKSHLKCHDGKGGGFPAKCDVCQRVFSRRHLMERHKLHKHTNAQSEFKCTECLKVFGHQRSLKRHFMSTHMGVKNHVCGMCGKAFCRKEYLTGHLIQHGAAEGYIRKARPSTSKPRPSVFNQQYIVKKEAGGGGDREEVEVGGAEKMEEMADDQQVQRIILHQDENGQLRVVDMAVEKEVRRMLESRLPKGEVGETMVVHIEEPSTGEPHVVHVEQATEEQVVEVPLEEAGYVQYQEVAEDQPQEYVISAASVADPANTQYIYTPSSTQAAPESAVEYPATSVVPATSNPGELIYGSQPAVQYEVECVVGDVGDDEALSAINLLAQASAQQYETVISQI